MIDWIKSKWKIITGIVIAVLILWGMCGCKTEVVEEVPAVEEVPVEVVPEVAPAPVEE